jgi:hypothetical protein
MWHGAGWTFIFWGFLHGAALVIHRIYKNMGYSMNSILAWFITFNFINIAWVFFRAKEWDDAIKVLRGMFGFDGVMNDYAYSVFLQTHRFSPSKVFSTIGGGQYTLNAIIIAFILTLYFKNSNEKLKDFKLNKYNMLFFSITFAVSVLYLNRLGDFLYFNF